MKVGFIGLGQMGSQMALNLVKAGHEVTVYNRTPAKAADLVAHGAKLAPDVYEACQGEVVITMLADDVAVENVVYGDRGILAGLARDGIHMSSSTISVALSERLSASHEAKGQRFVAAPVFGRPTAAAAGDLFVIAAGAAQTVQSVMPLFEVIGQRSFVLSEVPKTANLVKLSGNFLIAAMIESLGEAMALVAKGGVDKRAYLDILTSTLFGAPIFKTYGNLLVDGKFEPPGFAAPLGFKDIRLALTAGEELRVPLPLGSLLRDRFLTLLAHGGDNLDWSAIGGLPAKDAGEDVDLTPPGDKPAG